MLVATTVVSAQSYSLATLEVTDANSFLQAAKLKSNIKTGPNPKI